VKIIKKMKCIFRKKKSKKTPLFFRKWTWCVCRGCFGIYDEVVFFENTASATALLPPVTGSPALSATGGGGSTPSPTASATPPGSRTASAAASASGPGGG
jgi:hypothetical protein